MRIGIFANPIVQERTGVGRYAFNLVKEILGHDNKNEYILIGNFFRNSKKYRTELENFVKASGNQKTKIYITRLPDKLRDFLFGIFFPIKWIFPKDLDMYFALFPAHIAKSGYNNQISVIYDFVYDKYPETQGNKYSRYYHQRTRNAIEKSRKLFCISESTSNDLIKLFNINKNKTEIIYPAIDRKIFYPRKESENIKIDLKYNISKQYILTCGTIEPRKNLEKLIDAYIALPFILQEKYQLVIVGKTGWQSSGIIDKIKEVNQNNRIIQTDFVPDEDLANLYSGAEVFVYPSLYEGFGLPALEAIACGAPVITSNTSSLPEVVRDAGILVNPNSVEEIKDAIKKVLSSDNIKNEMTKKGFSQAKKFSWEESAIKAIKAFK